MSGGYLKQLNAMFDQGVATGERLARQYTIDSFQIALGRYEKLNLGYQRIMEITDLAEEIRQEYEGAIRNGPEADVMQERMDRELAEIIRGNAELIPFEERYPEVKKQNYKGKMK